MEIEKNPNKPGIGETIVMAWSMVHSQPALLISWLLLSFGGLALIYHYIC